MKSLCFQCSFSTTLPPEEPDRLLEMDNGRKGTSQTQLLEAAWRTGCRGHYRPFATAPAGVWISARTWFLPGYEAKTAG